MSYTDTPLWQCTLGFEDDFAAEQRNELKTAFESFRTQVAPILEEIQQSAPGLTKHGVSHSDALWRTAGMLAGNDANINPAEAFVLGSAFLVHDLGMGVSGYENGILGIISKPKFQDMLVKFYPDEAESIHAQLRADLEKNPNWDGLSSTKGKSVIFAYMRRNHARQARNILKGSWKPPNGKDSIQLIPNERLRHLFADTIGRIAESHWLDVNDLSKVCNPDPVKRSFEHPDEWVIDEIKIACLLRAADAINIDESRAPSDLLRFRNPQGESRHHWNFQSKIAAPQIFNDKVVFHSTAPFKVDEAEAWWLAYDTIKDIDRELRAVDNLCTDLRRPRLKASGVSGCDSSERLAEHLKTDAWIPVDVRPHIADGTKIMESLGGEALYGSNNHQWVPVRELIANALDATRLLRAVEAEGDPAAIVIEFDKGQSRDSLIVRDFGIGMNASDLANKLCAFGNSGWLELDDDEEDEYAGVVSSGFKPTGRFGIGFFSVFMVADYVQVTTRSWTAPTKDTLVLEFTGGIGSRPIMRRAQRQERLSQPGTKIQLGLKERLHDYKGLLRELPSNWTDSPKRIAKIVSRYALMADEDIDIKVSRTGVTHRAVSRNEWFEASPRRILSALNPILDLDRPQYEDIIERFSSVLSPVYDADGTLVGRIGVDIIEENQSSQVDVVVNKCAAYIGGMHADGVPGIIGVIAGKPQGAARDKVKFDVTLDNLQVWFREQVRRVLENAVNDDPLTQMEVQAYGISLGVLSEDLPLAHSRSEFLYPEDVRKLLRNQNSVRMIETYSQFLNTSSGAILSFPVWRNDFCVPNDSDICVYPGFSVYADIQREPLPVRSDELQDLLRDHVRNEDKFDIRTLWKTRYTCPWSEIVRMAAKEWELNLIEALDSTVGYYDERNADNRIHVPTIAGKRRKIEAMEITRPVRQRQ